jgi:hypothetical protein
MAAYLLHPLHREIEILIRRLLGLLDEPMQRDQASSLDEEENAGDPTAGEIAAHLP